MLSITLALLILTASAEINIELKEFDADPSRHNLIRDNVAFNKKVVGDKTSLKQALDADMNSAFVNKKGFESISAIDLGLVHEITEISLYVKNAKPENISPFHVHLGEQFAMSDHRDDFEKSIPVLRNFQFNATKQHLKVTLSGGFQARFVIFLDKSPFTWKLPNHQPFQVNEVYVRGRKIRYSEDIKFEFKEDVSALPDKFKEWQFAKKLTEGVPEMWSDSAYLLLPMTVHQGCVFGNMGGCTGVAGTHAGKGKFLATTSISLMDGVFNNGLFPKFKKNLESWICPTCDGFSKNKLEKNKINIIDKRAKYNLAQLVKFLSDGYSMVFYVDYHKKFLRLSEALHFALIFKLASWKRQPLQTDAECKDHLPIDVLFGLIKGPVENIFKVHFAYNTNIFTSRAVKKRIDDKLREKYTELMGKLHGFGLTKYKPIEGKLALKFVAFLTKSAHMVFGDHLPFPALPGTSHFPPSSSSSAQRSTVKVTITTHTGQQRISAGVGAGRAVAFSYRVIRGNTGDWKLCVGMRKDELFRKTKLYRLPVISELIPLKRKGTVAAIASGIIQLYLDKDLSKKGLKPRGLVIEFQNVYRTAVFDRRLPDPWAFWQKTFEETEYPLVELRGEVTSQGTLLTYLTESTKEDFFGVAEIFDSWFIINHNVRGTDWKLGAGDVFAYDVQISHGLMHAGYPIMCPLGTVQTKIQPILKTGSWGHCHELGHNFQQNFWQLPETVEVTNNVLCYYNYNETLHLPTFTFPTWKMFADKELKELQDQWKSSNWSAKMYQLNYYMLFNWKFGKGFWTNIIRFLNHVQKEKSDYNTNEYLVYAMSKTISYDFSPYHELYNMPLRQKVKDATKEFGECWMPGKELTADVEDKIAEIEAAHGSKCTRKAKIIEPIADLVKDINVVRKDRVKATMEETTGVFRSGFVPKRL